jgi:hypothetical protein
MKGGFMAYTPELSEKHSCTLRRIAWVLDMPMTKAMDAVFDHAVKIVDRQKICVCCRDQSRCGGCEFGKKQHFS